MLRYLSIVVFVALLFQKLQAQDSLSTHYQGIRERVDQIHSLRNNLYQNPSLRPFQYQYSLTPVDISYRSEKKDLYNFQEGSGIKGFRFNTDSYQKDAFPNITLWGKASYENIKLQDLKFNESSDFDIVFPYVTADSVGGDLNSEIYQFAGGIAKEIGKWTLAGEAGYRANLAHRKKDPRPENNTSDINAKVGASYQFIENYIVGANIGFNFYKQRNTLTFVAVTGRPAIFHFNGLASFNSLLSGSTENTGAILYESKGLNAQFTIAPKNENGLFLELGINQHNGFRTLAYSTASANDWTDQIFNAKLGYFQSKDNVRYGAIAKVDLQTRKGTEGLFNNDGGNTGYAKISEISSYRYYNFNYNLEAFVGMKDWSIKPYATFTQIKEQYLNPFREQSADIVKVGVQGQYLVDLKEGLFGISLNLQKQKVLNKNSVFNINQGTALESLLMQNYSYLTSEPFSIAGELRYDFVASGQIKPFIKAEGLTSTEIKQKYGSLTLGLVF